MNPFAEEEQKREAKKVQRDLENLRAACSGAIRFYDDQLMHQMIGCRDIVIRFTGPDAEINRVKTNAILSRLMEEEL